MSNALQLTSMPLYRRLWFRIKEPRVISVLYCLIYLCLTLGGMAALVEPPSTIQGEVGMQSMYMLAGMLTVGGVVGVVSSLPGIWWLERIAVAFVAAAAIVYGFILVALHVTTPGNRLLQLSMITTVLLMQLVRWHRLSQYPYDPSVPRTH